MGLTPVCWVCGRKDESVMSTGVLIVARREFKSPQERSQTLNVEMCNSCYGSASLSNMAASARPADPAPVVQV